MSYPARAEGLVNMIMSSFSCALPTETITSFGRALLTGIISSLGCTLAIRTMSLLDYTLQIRIMSSVGWIWEAICQSLRPTALRWTVFHQGAWLCTPYILALQAAYKPVFMLSMCSRLQSQCESYVVIDTSNQFYWDESALFSDVFYPSLCKCVSHFFVI